MPIQIGQSVDHGFDQPLGLLSDCHRRIEHFLHVLTALADKAGEGPLTPDHRRALEGALRYFAVAAPKHTADEETSLFPRLRDSHDPALAEALAAVDRLERDHQEADCRHRAVDEIGHQWLTTGQLAPAELVRLREHLARLQALYASHIAVEDGQVFPAAARVLDRAQIEAIGREMAARRQVQPALLDRVGR